MRAGEQAFLIEGFINKNVIAIGWNETGDLMQVKNLEEIKQLLRNAYDDYKPGQVNMNAGQLARFRFEFKIGDNVLTYNPAERLYWLGEIISDYEYMPDLLEYYHTRRVKWINKISRDLLSATTRNTLGSIMTVFEISTTAANEICNLLNSKSLADVEEHESKEQSLQVIKEEVVAKAHEFIKDKMLNLDWEEMQELIAGILRAMGYKTRVSPKGADRGKDIVASPDGLGLEEPRILAEVKHRQGQMGSPEVRSFLGGLRGKDKGLYISTSGFSREAKYEAERADMPITLIDADELVNLIVQYYDNFDAEARALLSLKKIYWPV